MTFDEIPITLQRLEEYTGVPYKALWNRLEPRGRLKWRKDGKYIMTTLAAYNATLVDPAEQQKNPVISDRVAIIKARIAARRSSSRL